jgi:hypothetical protein
MHRTVALAAAAGLVWLAAGCSSSTTSSSTHYDPASAQPPPLLVHTDHGTAPAAAWTYCWRTPGQSQCADGGPRPPYADAAPGSVATFEFHVSPGWRFSTLFHRAWHPCAPAYGARATSTADDVWTVPTAGPAGTWLVEVHGRGPEGDVASTFRWRTTGAGHGHRVAPSPVCAGR